MPQTRGAQIGERVTDKPKRILKLALVCPRRLTRQVTPITSVLLAWHCCALFALRLIAIVPIETNVVPPLRVNDSDWGVYMRMMHLCYAAIGFAVARWIFRRQAMPLVDPVTRFRSQGLL